ncbi:MAG: rhomboid family intramembrane serine protease [Actinobacteria bacterium]|nr:rhomboid family intramembrane serine protease [Actinomycetota bacterium]
MQAAVGSHCLDCAKAARPDIKSRAQIWNARQLTPVTTVLMGISIAVFLWMALKDSATLRGNATQAHFDLSLNAIPLKFDHEWYRLITSGFVHFGFIHLAFNMFALYQLGQLVERAVPHIQFALLYFASLLGGSLGVLLVEGTGRSPTAGASGAVFGLLGAAAVGLHRRGINVFSTGIGTALLLNLFITFSIPGISIGGHLGGLVAGAICGYVMLAPRAHQSSRWVGYAVPVAVGAVCVVASVMYVNSLDFSSLF